MQKKKKVSKTKAKTVKKSVSKPIVKKVAKKMAAKKEASPKVAAPKAAASKVSPKVSSKVPKVEAKTISSSSYAAPISKADFKNMSPDAQENYKKWLKLHKQLAEEKTLDYKMTDDFEIKTPISHKVHGWGVVLQKRDNYIDVLFELGMKTLIVNYKT